MYCNLANQRFARKYCVEICIRRINWWKENRWEINEWRCFLWGAPRGVNYPSNLTFTVTCTACKTQLTWKIKHCSHVTSTSTSAVREEMLYQQSSRITAICSEWNWCRDVGVESAVECLANRMRVGGVITRYSVSFFLYLTKRMHHRRRFTDA